MREWVVETAIRMTAFLLPISVVALIISILVLLPVAVWRKARVASGYCLVVMSYPLWLTTWFFGAAVAFASFGWFGLIIGLLLFGIGVVPMGVIGAFSRLNSNVIGFALCMFCAITLATWRTGIYLLEGSDTCPEESDNMRNKTLAIFGIGTYILSVLTSASDLEGNPLMPFALIVISGIAALLFDTMAIVRLWKSARNVSITFASSIIILFIFGVIQEATSPAYGSPIIIMVNVLTVINFVVFVWAIIRLFKMKENSQLSSMGKQVPKVQIARPSVLA